MELLRIDPVNPAPDAVERAAAILRDGGLVAFPTETVYGLGANALDAAAVRRIFAAKGRPAFNPLIAHVAGLAAARVLASQWPEWAERLGERFWPGPLTLVVRKRADIPNEVTAGLATVALRVPAHPVAQALLAAAGLPVAAPSANRYTQVSPTTAEHVVKGLGGRVDLVLDGGPAMVGIESTVIDLSGDRPVLLRPGSIAPAALEEVVGPLARPGDLADDAPRPAPGMVRRHYSPRGELRIVPPGERDALGRMAAEAAAAGRRVGALLLGDAPGSVHHPVRMPASADDYARALYAALHELDDRGCDLILADALPEAPEWHGVRDRLARAEHRD